jgi:hypothetical protein
MIDTEQGWKLALAIVLLAGVLTAAYARAPRQSVPRAELRQLMLAALCLYAVGLAASLTHHGSLAAIVYAAGISTCALALWLSRGQDSGEGPDGGQDPGDEHPPPDPGDASAFDWAAFERQFRDYAHEHEPLRG